MVGSIRATLAAIVMALTAGTPLLAQTTPAPPSPEVLKELAPTGRLRAAINLGNAVLAQGTPQDPKGITVDLSRELARRTGLPLDLVPFDLFGDALHGLLDRDAEFFRRFLEIRRLDGHLQRQRPRAGHQLRLTDKSRGPGRVKRAVRLHRRQPSNRADFQIREGFLQIEILGVQPKIIRVYGSR